MKVMCIVNTTASLNLILSDFKIYAFDVHYLVPTNHNANQGSTVIHFVNENDKTVYRQY